MFVRSKAKAKVRPGSNKEETPREFRPKPPPSRGSPFEAAFRLLRCLNLGTSPKSWSGSGDRLPPFGLGTPPEGARSEPASETVAGLFGLHRIASMAILNVRPPPRTMQAQGVPRFRVSVDFFAAITPTRHRRRPDWRNAGTTRATRRLRFGFEPPNPEWNDHFQIKALSEPRSSIKGTFRYTPPFDSVSS